MAAALPSGRQGRVLALGLLVLAAIVLWLGMAAPLMDLYDAETAKLAQRSALAARMTVLAAELPELQTRAAAVPANNGTATFDGATDALAGATLSSTETLTAEPAGPYRRIGVKLSISAPLPVLAQLLAQIEQSRPPMLIDDLQIHGSPIVLPGVTASALDVGFTVYGFRSGGTP